MMHDWFVQIWELWKMFETEIAWIIAKNSRDSNNNNTVDRPSFEHKQRQHKNNTPNHTIDEANYHKKGACLFWRHLESFGTLRVFIMISNNMNIIKYLLSTKGKLLSKKFGFVEGICTVYVSFRPENSFFDEFTQLIQVFPIFSHILKSVNSQCIIAFLQFLPFPAGHFLFSD